MLLLWFATLIGRILAPVARPLADRQMATQQILINHVLNWIRKLRRGWAPGDVIMLQDD
jgi:hypothetical protein